MESDYPASVCAEHDRASRVRGPEGYAPDGALRLRAEGAAAEFVLRNAALHGAQPLFRSESNALLRVGQRRPGRDDFRHPVQRQYEIQRIASRASETDESGFAVSSLVYVLQVHVRQHWVLWRMEQCSQRLRILAECLRPTSGVGAVLLRCYSRNFSLRHLRSALWPRQDVGQER